MEENKKTHNILQLVNYKVKYLFLFYKMNLKKKKIKMDLIFIDHPKKEKERYNNGACNNRTTYANEYCFARNF